MQTSVKKYVVYLHRRNDTGVVFYVGQGTPSRPASKTRRSASWYEVVNTAGYSIEVFKDGLTKSEALSLEKELIGLYPDLINDKSVNSGRLSLTYELFDEYFQVDPSSPSGLIWKKSNGGNRKANIKNPGDTAGYKMYRPNGEPSHFILSFKGSRFMVHRIVWLLSKGSISNHPELVIDHINRNPFDNRIENLREVDYQTNAFNCSIRNDNASGVRGVSFVKMGNLFYYSATWRENGKVKSKNFSIKKHGEKESLRLATEYRNKMVEYLELK